METRAGRGLEGSASSRNLPVLFYQSLPFVGGALAHEMGHAFGCRRHKPIEMTPDILMGTHSDRGFFIPRMHALIMREEAA